MPQVAIKDIERVFFDAMSCGYISGNMPELYPAEDFTKRFMFTDHSFRVEDKWTSISGNKHSFGRTLITYNGMPVWYMQYAGWYEDVALPLLKTALSESYRDRLFLGGRGPRRHCGEGLVYLNALKANGSFVAFSGRECICESTNGRLLGEHHYSGGSMQ